MKQHKHIKSALEILATLGFSRAQQNDRSALCLLALLNMTPKKSWTEAESPLIGITPMMDFAGKYYNRIYKPNTRETFRRQSIHQFVQAGLALYNPDMPHRPVNSPKAVYQIEQAALSLIRTFGTPQWSKLLNDYIKNQKQLSSQYSSERERIKVALKISSEYNIVLSPGSHSELIKSIIEEFAPRFTPGAELVYIGDTEKKWGHFNKPLLDSLGVAVDTHGKMPDVILYWREKNWLLLVEAVTSHGPINPKRHHELSRGFADSRAGIVYLTAFPDKPTLIRYINEIAWETEVWVSDTPDHLIHFDGERFLGPY